MNKTDKTIAIIILIGIVYTFIVGIIAIKQYFKIQTLQDNNADYQQIITQYKQDIESPEYLAVKKCKKQDVWVAECISWELNNGK